MTGDPPRRWDDDSPEENFEAHRASEHDRLDQWAREQKTRPLTDLLGPPGSRDGESWVTYIRPDWFDLVAEPHDQCAWCQRPGMASPCGQCRQARERGGDPASMWAWWAGLSPADRRLLLAARWRRDPWTGQPVTITAERAEVDQDGNLTVEPPVVFNAPTVSTAWDLLRRES